MAGGTGGSLPKSSGNTIYGADYNAVRTKIDGVLGAGGSYGVTYGYNQTLTSVPATVTAKVTATQWVSLVNDISKAYQHQTGVAFSTINPTIGQTISVLTINTLSSTCDTLLTNRLTANAGQLTSVQVAQPTYASAWGGGGTGIQSITNLAVGAGVSAANAQYFFNQGGKIVITGYTSGSGWTSSPTDQNADWYNAMVAMSATINYATYASILASGATYIQLYSNTSFPSPYTTNFVYIYANTPDSGLSINVRITYEDNHADAGSDTVDGGTIGATFNAYNASGAFTGVIPTASIPTNFTAGTYTV